MADIARLIKLPDWSKLLDQLFVVVKPTS